MITCSVDAVQLVRRGVDNPHQVLVGLVAAAGEVVGVVEGADLR